MFRYSFQLSFFFQKKLKKAFNSFLLKKLSTIMGYVVRGGPLARRIGRRRLGERHRMIVESIKGRKFFQNQTSGMGWEVYAATSPLAFFPLAS